MVCDRCGIVYIHMLKVCNISKGVYRVWVRYVGKCEKSTEIIEKKQAHMVENEAGDWIKEGRLFRTESSHARG